MSNFGLRTMRGDYSLDTFGIVKEVEALYPHLFRRGIKLTSIGLGTQGIIFDDPLNPKRVLKLGLDRDKMAKLENEYENHMEFYKRFQTLKRQGFIWDHLQMPEPLDILTYKGETVFTMERMQGQSLKTKEIIARHFGNLKGVEKLRLNNLTDLEIEELAKSQYGLQQSELDLLAIEALDSVRKFYPGFMVRELQQSLNRLKALGAVHTDFHSGNLMVDTNFNFSIIDFGSVKIKKESEEQTQRVKGNVRTIL